jgi:hypothetical protein
MRKIDMRSALFGMLTGFILAQRKWPESSKKFTLARPPDYRLALVQVGQKTMLFREHVVE